MKKSSAIIIGVVVLASLVIVSACDPTAQEMVVRMRMQQLINMFPAIYDDIRTGRLVPNRPGYQQQQQNQNLIPQNGQYINPTNGQQMVMPNNQQGYINQIPNQYNQQGQMVPNGQQGQMVVPQGQMVVPQGQMVVPQNG